MGIWSKVMTEHCPHCGKSIEVQITGSGRGSWRIGTGRGSWNVSRMRQYHSTPFGQDAPPFVEFAEAVRQEPIRAPTVSADVWVPFLTAAISGVIALACAIPVTIAASWPWWVPLLFGLAILAVVWGVRSGLGWKLLFVTERITGRDISGDDQIGKPMDEWRVEITEKDEEGNAKAMRFLYPPRGVSPDQFAEYVRAVLGGGGLGYDRWVGDGPFSRSQYDHILSELRRLGYARNVGGSVGHQLTAQGQAVFKWLAMGKP